MKPITTTRYEAFDGATFDTAAECRQHERDMAPKRLEGLTADQVAAALDRSDPELAEAVERCAYLISSARKAAGELKRKPRENGQGASDQEGSAAGEEPASTQEPDAAAAPSSGSAEASSDA